MLSTTSRKLKRKFNQIERTYEAHEWIADVEMDNQEDSMYGSSMQHFIEVSNQPTSMHYILVRNTAYVFTNGECVARHDKVAPYYELGDAPRPNELFQPATKKRHSPYIKLKFADGTTLPIGVEICREHLVGVLKRECMRINKNQNPVIHFLLSNWISSCNKHVVGDYFMHVDSEEIHSVVAKSDNQQVQVVQYRNNLFDAQEVDIGQAYVPSAVSASATSSI
jgi:hypothetical protein